MIQMRKVGKLYRATPALRDIDLEIGAGEFVTVMGPSGSGKSTLLNLLGALDAPTSGRVIVDGNDLGALDDEALTLFRRRRVGFVFQFFNLLPTLDALGNVMLPLLLERRADARDQARARGLLDEVGLGGRLHARIHELSGGEMQRVAIARALVHEPGLLLADEPTGNLDSGIGGEILALLRGVCDRRRTTVVMVTHDPQPASMGHRLIGLRDGALVKDQRTGTARREAGP